MQLAILLLLAIFGCQPTIAANCTFVRPGLDVPNDGVNNPVYSEDQVIAIEWEWSDGMTSGDIIMWQDFPLNSDGTQLINHVEDNVDGVRTTYQLPLASGWNLAKGRELEFHFTMNAAGGGAFIMCASHGFNYTLSDSTATTTSATREPSSTRTSSIKSSSPSTATRSSSRPSSKSTSQPSSESSSGGSSTLSGGTIAGISVGATLGGVLAVGGLGFLLWRMRKKRSLQQPAPAYYNNAPRYNNGAPGYNNGAPPYNNGAPPYHDGGPGYKVELMGSSRMHEAP